MFCATQQPSLSFFQQLKTMSSPPPPPPDASEDDDISNLSNNLSALMRHPFDMNGSNSEFKIQNEDFPALPGSNSQSSQNIVSFRSFLYI